MTNKVLHLGASWGAGPTAGPLTYTPRYANAVELNNIVTEKTWTGIPIGTAAADRLVVFRYIDVNSAVPHICTVNPSGTPIIPNEIPTARSLGSATVLVAIVPTGTTCDFKLAGASGLHFVGLQVATIEGGAVIFDGNNKVQTSGADPQTFATANTIPAGGGAIAFAHIDTNASRFPLIWTDEGGTGHPLTDDAALEAFVTNGSNGIMAGGGHSITVGSTKVGVTATAPGNMNFANMNLVVFGNKLAWTPKDLPNIVSWITADTDDYSPVFWSDPAYPNGTQLVDYDQNNATIRAIKDQISGTVTAIADGYFHYSPNTDRRIRDHIYVAAGTTNTPITISIPITDTGKLSVFVIAACYRGAGSNDRVASISSGGAINDWSNNHSLEVGYDGSSPPKVQVYHNNVGALSDAPADVTWGVTVSGTSMKMFAGAALNQVDTTKTIPTPAFVSPLSLSLCVQADGGGMLWGSLYEVIVVNGDVSDADRVKLASYLATKWA